MAKFKITKKGKYMIELVGTDKSKTPLTVGYKKSILFLSLNSKNVGDEVEVDTEVSSFGRAYATDNNNYLKAMQEARKFQLEERNIANMMAAGTV